MFGCEITLASRLEANEETGIATEHPPTMAVGCIFNDGSIYVHEPICDMWASIPDMLEEIKPAGFRVVGPVIPIEEVREHMKATYKSSMAMLREQMQAYKQGFHESVASLTRFDQYNTPISFMQKTDEPEAA